MMTSQSDSQAISKAMTLGATDYLIKPCKPKDLLDILRRYVRGSPMPPRIIPPPTELPWSVP